jgi:hypothetical protein
MVEALDNLLIYNAFEQTEVHHHTQLWRVGVALWLALDGNKQTV